MNIIRQTLILFESSHTKKVSNDVCFQRRVFQNPMLFFSKIEVINITNDIIITYIVQHTVPLFGLLKAKYSLISHNI